MSRKIFGTDGIRGMANVYPITPEIAMKLGRAIGYLLRKEKNPKIVIGKDTRLSGYMIENALTAGIVSMGVDVHLIGPLPTPSVAILTKAFSANIGVVITASHNPAKDNGIKIFNKDGFKLTDKQEEEIEDIIFSKRYYECENEFAGDKIGKAHRVEHASGRYISFAKSTIKHLNLSGMKIVLDCANGASYFVAPKIFSELGAEVVVLNDKPDGLNINLDCGAIYPEVAAEIVKKEKADIGITLDGDADRVIVCDENGEVIDGDSILTFCALEMLKDGKLNNKTLVVTDYSNLGVDDALKKEGAKVIRTKNGDRYVIESMHKEGSNLGGENSGHIIFLDYTTTGDGIISALNLLSLLKQRKLKASDVKKAINKYPQVLLNIEVKERKDFNDMPDLQKKIKEIKETLGTDGRILLRYSGTENLCRFMIEGKDQKQIEKMAEEVSEEIKKEVGV